MKKVLVIFIVFCTLFAFLVPGVLADAGSKSEVMKDLEGSTIGGRVFSAADYPANATGQIQLIGIGEVGFSDSDRDRWALYLYLYNPHGLFIDWSAKNTVQMAVATTEAGNPSLWEKFDLELVSSSTETDMINRFVKVKVVDHRSAVDMRTMAQRLTATRQYWISGIELTKAGAGLPTDYSIGCCCTVTGEGDEQETKIEDITVISLNPVQSYYRTDEYRDGHRWQINFCYFTVPNSVWRAYDYLYSVRAEWRQMQTQPMIITNDETLYNSLKQEVWPGPYLDNDGKLLPYTRYYLYTGKNQIYTPSTGYTYTYRWAYPTIKNAVCYDSIDQLRWLFRSSQAAMTLGTGDISSADLLRYINTSSFADLFTNPEEPITSHEIVFDEVFPVTNYADNNGIIKTLFKKWLTGVDVDTVYDRPCIESFERKLTMSADEIMTAYGFSNQEDAAKFLAAVNSAATNNSTVVLMRYGYTDYWAEFLDTSPVIEGQAYVSSQTVYADFDVIQLTFAKDAVQVVIPVSSDPQHVTTEIETPQTDGYDFSLPFAGLGDRLAKIGKVLLYSILAILILLVILIVTRVVGWFGSSRK